MTAPTTDWPNIRAAIVYHFDTKTQGWQLTGMVGYDPKGPELSHLLSQSSLYRYGWIYLDTAPDPCGVLFTPGVTTITHATVIYGNCMDGGGAAQGGQAVSGRRGCS